MNIYTAAITLLLVMDPFGNIPLFLSLLKDVSSKRRRTIIIREMCIALAVLSVFLFFGKYILSGLDISEPALGISGGIILFLIALKMIFPKRNTSDDRQDETEPIIVPLAVPLIAGPSSMSIVILFSTQHPKKLLSWSIALIAAWAVCLCILLLSDLMSRLLGTRILKAIERLMGMILTTMAVQMLLRGVQKFIGGL
ncbi:MAG: NAAT family transporter [Spirochaetes bacterium]|nr:NAAT family transporter [Spirochaetota bacterium]